MKPRKPLLRKTRLNPVSPKRRVEGKIYAKLRLEFLKAHPFCQVWLRVMGDESPGGLSEKYAIEHDGHFRINSIPSQCPRATEIHHREKRGANYLKTETWMAVSRPNHERIENNKTWARQMGFLK